MLSSLFFFSYSASNNVTNVAIDNLLNRDCIIIIPGKLRREVNEYEKNRRIFSNDAVDWNCYTHFWNDK
jgi:hypothetical protein